jgi:hypothetical protein
VSVKAGQPQGPTERVNRSWTLAISCTGPTAPRWVINRLRRTRAEPPARGGVAFMSLSIVHRMVNLCGNLSLRVGGGRLEPVLSQASVGSCELASGVPGAAVAVWCMLIWGLS